jgi:hypothetical protein
MMVKSPLGRCYASLIPPPLPIMTTKTFGQLYGLTSRQSFSTKHDFSATRRVDHVP